MSFLYMAGLSSNLVTTATLSSSSEDANFPRSNLQKDFVFNMFRFNTAGTDDTLTADLGSATPVTFSSVHFHNIGAGITSVQLLSDDNAGFTTPTTRATFTVTTPAFYASFAAGSSERYWRLKFNGTNSAPLYVGKWVLGVSSSLAEIQQWEWSVRYEMEQLQSQPGVPLNRTTHARRILELPFRNTTAAAKNEILDLLDDSGWGAGPIVAAPDSDESDVIYGRARNTLDIRRQSDLLFEHGLTIEEDRFPVVTT